ncbi:hypothetical protein ACXX9E_29825 [Pseudomonas sp. GNP014]
MPRPFSTSSSHRFWITDDEAIHPGDVQQPEVAIWSISACIASAQYVDAFDLSFMKTSSLRLARASAGAVRFFHVCSICPTQGGH